MHAEPPDSPAHCELSFQTCAADQVSAFQMQEQAHRAEQRISEAKARHLHDAKAAALRLECGRQEVAERDSLNAGF